MAVKIKFDNSHNPIQPTLVLAKRSGDKLGYIPATSISITDAFNAKFDLEFTVYKYLDGEQFNLWDSLTDFKLVWCKEWDVWFEAYVTLKDGDELVKQVTCVSLGEAELSQIYLYDININNEDDIARDDYEVTVLYDEDNPNASLLDRIMEKAPHYSIKHVDTSIKGIQRTFEFDNKTIYDAMQEIAEEIDCIFIFNSGTDDDGNIERSISVYDLENYCLDCGERGSFVDTCEKCGKTNIKLGYGEDTNIFVSKENLAEDIQMEVDTDSVKNCFRLEAGDDLMTSTIISCNPNGSQYLWYIPEETRADMSDELREKLDSYDELYNSYFDDIFMELDSDKSSAYNTLVDKYVSYNEDLNKIPSLTDDDGNITKYGVSGYSNLIDLYYDTYDFYLLLNDTLMPVISTTRTTAALQAAKLGHNSMSPVAVENLSKASSITVSNAVLAVAKTIISPTYQVKVKDYAYDNNVWTGSFTVTNYSDETDTANSTTFNIQINEDEESLVKQKINNIISNKQDDSDMYSISSVFSEPIATFTEDIKKYCLTYLNIFKDACQSCLDLMIQNGIAISDNDLHNELYSPYYEKMLALDNEIKTRKAEIAIVTGDSGMREAIDNVVSGVQDALNFQNYIGDLWKEFITFRREDTYSNDNYISDGLTNTELIKNAQEFINIARKEIYKSATMQHSISTSLKNLLVMKEFTAITDYFAVGNWIHIGSDGDIYKLRLISYDINFSDLDTINVDFSDVKKCADGFSDLDDVLGQAQSMATSYSSILRQSKTGKKSTEQLDNWVDNGLALTKMKIIDDSDNQNMMWDDHGLIMRQYNDITDDYEEKQLKIINKGLYITDDGWATAKAGIGDFIYWNPETREYEEAYGVVADTIVGNLILGKEVGIYNVDNSITLDENGFTLTTNDDSGNVSGSAFTIRRMVDGEYEDLMYVNTADGNLVFNGSVTFNSNGALKTIEEVTDYSFKDICERAAEGVDDSGSEEDRVGKIASNIIEGKFIEDISGVIDNLEDYKTTVGQYLTFDEAGLTIGARATDSNNQEVISPFRTIIDNESMRFMNDTTTIAYISGDSLYVPNAAITESIYFGDPASLDLGGFFLSPRADGGISIVWRDPKEGVVV